MSNEKIKVKINKSNENYKFMGKASLLIDNARLKILSNLKSDELKMNFAMTIKNDEIKLKAINFIDSDTYKVQLAETIKNDNYKIQTIDMFDEIDYKVRIMTKIKDSNKKIEALDGYTDPEIFGAVMRTIDVFNNLSNDNGLYEFLDVSKDKGQDTIQIMKDQINKANSIKEIKNDEEKITALEELESEYLRAEVAKTITDDDKKMKTLADFNNDWSKSIIIKELKDDNKKIETLKSFSNDVTKVEIAKSIQDDSKKIETISLFKDSFAKRMICQTIKDDNKKVEIMPLLDNDRDRTTLVETMQDDNKKIEVIPFLKNNYYIEDCIMLIDNENKRLEMMSQKFTYSSLENFYETYKKDEIAKNPKFQELKETIKMVKKAQSIKEDDKKIEIIDSLDNENLKVEIIETLNDDKQIIQCLNKINDETLKFQIIESIKDNDKKLNVIQELNPKQLHNYRNACENIDFIKDNISIFIKNEGFEDKNITNIIEELYEKNNQVVKNIDFRILNEKYLNTFGKDKINLISCYSNIQEDILKLDDKQCNIFSKCIDGYTEKTQTDEWTILGEELLKHISNGEYDSLFENIDDVDKLSKQDYEALSQVLQNNNWCKISNIEDARNFEKIRQEKCNEIMENKYCDISQKKEAVIQKIFGHDFEYGKNIIERFGEDIENIKDCDEKDYVRALELINDVQDIKVLEEIFDECEFIQTDKTLMERSLKNQYGKMFNEGLFSPKAENLVDGYSNVYNAGVDFKIIMTSLGAYSGPKEKQNYKDDWNRPAISTQHFCASYIRNDMIGTAPIEDICYGFSSMKEDALMLSGNHDIYSSTDSFNSIGYNGEKYYTPDNQINNTVRYNEMDFRRIQGGEKKQPDYILVFRKNGNIPNMDKAQIASKQWGDMPIVVIDVDECLESEKSKVEQMCKEYKENPSDELKKKINQKVRNNRVTNNKFCQGIDKQLMNYETKEPESKENNVQKHTISEKDLEENYQKVSANERKKEMTKITDLYKKIQEISRGDEYAK